jgi:hypothetical protein
MTMLKYSFKTFIVNGLGADFLRICKVYHHCQRRQIKLYMDAEDDWQLVPSEPRTWRFFFESLEMTSAPLPLVNNHLIASLEKEPISFEELKQVAHELFQPTKRFIFSCSIHPIVLHVRRGDKVSGSWKEGIFHELREYYECVPQYTPSEVYVMTDSPQVYEEAKQKGFIVDDHEIRRDGFVKKHYDRPYDSMSLMDEATTFFKNMSILKNATHLVGSNASFFYVLGQVLHGKQGISLSNNVSYYTFG